MSMNIPWLSHDETWREGDDVIQRTVEVITGLGGAKAVIGIEKRSWFLTVHVAEGLAARLPEARFVDASQMVDRIRHIKSERELAYIRKAGAIAEEEIRTAIDVMRRRGSTEADVAAAVLHTGVSAGCGIHRPAAPHHVGRPGHGLHSANWTLKPIVPGELVAIELYGCVERYHATQVRTVSIGEPSHQTRAAADLVISRRRTPPWQR